MNIVFPGLSIAACRLHLDDAELAEATLCKMDAGFGEMEAIQMTIIEALQRRRAYHGRLKQAVEDGTIFQMAEGGDEGDGFPGPRLRAVDARGG